jgi:hypothetical protein
MVDVLNALLQVNRVFALDRKTFTLFSNGQKRQHQLRVKKTVTGHPAVGPIKICSPPIHNFC